MGRKKSDNSKDYVELMRDARSASRAKLDRDRIFTSETQRIEGELTTLLTNYPGIFDRFFREFSDSAVRSRAEKLREFLTQAPPRARRILENYVAYSLRFRVWLKWGGQQFQIRTVGPWKNRFRAKLARGFLKEIDPEPPEVPMIEDERYTDDDMQIPGSELQSLLNDNEAKFFQLEDEEGKSVLHQLEELAYDPEGLTFVLHKGSQGNRDYLFLLVGENVRVDSQWRKAGKAVNAIQRQLYERIKSGRPRKVEKWKKATQLRGEMDGKPMKAKAYELLEPTEQSATKLRSAQSFISKARQRNKIKPSK